MAKATGYDSLQNSRTLKLAHTAAVTPGDIIVSNLKVLIAINTTALNVANAYVYYGAMTLPKKAATAFTALVDRVYWDESANEITNVAIGNIPCGYCARDAASADTTIRIFLDQPNVVQSHSIIASGIFDTLGGDVNEAITITDALVTDIAIVTLETVGATPRTITTSKAAAGQIDVVLSGDPSTDHNLAYLLLRAVV